MSGMRPARRSLPVNERLFNCWFHGLTIRAAMASVRTGCGVELTFDQVRDQFVNFSERFGRATMENAA